MAADSDSEGSLVKKMLFFLKTDLSTAFRMVPLSLESWKWLVNGCKKPKDWENNVFLQ